MQSLTQIEQIFIHGCEAMLLIDPHADKILQANPASQRLFGYSEQAMMTMNASTLFMENVSQLVNLTLAAMHRREAWSNDITARNSDGTLCQLEISVSAYGNQDHELLVCILREKERLEKLREVAEANSLHRTGLMQWKTIESVFREFERENQLILSAAGEGIYGIDANGRTTFVNPAAENILGWQAADLIGKDIHNIIHHSHSDGSQYSSHECHIHASFKDGQVRHVEDEVFWLKDGTHIAVEYTSTPILDQGRLLGAVVIFRDISERRMAESKLRSALDEVQQLKKRLEMENEYLQEEYRTEHHYKEIVGRSTAIGRIIQQIELVAPTDANVLISGESGTGKELIARAIHESSQRHNRPLIRVNCASIPRELFESEFFGHVKGAFTGAVSNRAGRFELADGGTLFLDEVGEIPLELQGKLLRVLQEQQFERIGESHTRRVNVRIIAATNKNLKQASGDGLFREDLYFRLNVFPIESVPLRERTEDIPLLASHFLQRACTRSNKDNLHFSVGDMRKMQAYSWPGNIRELINLIERSVILAKGSRLHIDIPEDDLKPLTSSRSDSDSLLDSINILTESDRQQMDRKNIIMALRCCHGKIFGESGAAQLLGIKPTTLISRIKRYSINRYQFKAETAKAVS